MTPFRRAALAPVLVLVAALSACASSSAGTGGDGLTLADPWAKAAESGMTAAFGTLTNETDTDITITAAEADIARMELHEVAANADGAMVMQPKEGGFVVPAHGTHVLEPGHDHIMFMDLTTPLEPGDDVTLTLTSDDGTSWTFTIPVRTFDGAAESYQAHEGTDMGTESPDEESSDS